MHNYDLIKRLAVVATNRHGHPATGEPRILSGGEVTGQKPTRVLRAASAPPLSDRSISP